MRRIGSWGAGVGAVVLVCSATARAAEPVRSYAGHDVLRVQAGTPAAAESILSRSSGLWSENVGPVMDVCVSPSQRAALDADGVRYTVLIEDVQRLIDRERAEIAQRGASFYTSYHTHTEIVNYMNALAASRPDIASVIPVGTTWQGRTMWGIRITGTAPGAKGGVLYHGCQHAREWITPCVPLYIAEHLIENYGVDATITELLDRSEWFLIPVVNVDGYLYTWSNNRFWRKNRHGSGIDLNRNWGVGWGGPGSSDSSGSETYRGTAPFSEPETASLRDFFLAHPNIRCHIDYHSYSQLILWAWGYTSELSPDEPALSALGRVMQQDILDVHGMFYAAGPVYTTIYPASGVASDWSYGAQGTLSYGWELRDRGEFGFVLPADQIIPTCEEILPSALRLADRATQRVWIDFPEGRPDAAPFAEPLSVAVRISANVQSPVAGTARVHYRIDAGQDFTAVPLTVLGGDDYAATLPATVCPRVVEYYFSVETDGGETVHSPATAPAETYTAPVSHLVTLLEDNFEDDLGWTVESVLPVDGAWQRGDPAGLNGQGYGNVQQPEDDNPEGTGTMCYVTGKGTVNMVPGAKDVDHGPTRLISPVFDMAGRDAVVTFYAWVYTRDVGDDVLQVQVSTDGGSNWTTAMTLGDRPAWTRYSLRLSDVVTPTSQTRIRFSISDIGDNSTTEGLVDDVVVRLSDCDDVPGDYDGNGVVDGADLGRFVETLVGLSSDPVDLARSDYNADFVVDARDIPGFLALQ